MALPKELAAVLAFDASVFSNPGDYMSSEDWLSTSAYWMLIDKERVGCCGLQPDIDYDDTPKKGDLYIASIAIAAKWRGQHLGTRFTEWQVEYARKRGYSSIVTNTRDSNAGMIRVYEKLGFTERPAIDH